jgi:molybdenum cofactor biosynthesis enzyme MoaA
MDIKFLELKFLVKNFKIRKLQIASREPLLWKDNNYDIGDLCNYLTENNIKVDLTTNGSLLYYYIRKGKINKNNVSSLKISWHTTDPHLYKDISGGKGNYLMLLKGIKLAIRKEIKISFNRILFNGYFDDLPQQIRFISNHNLKLKLYTLLYTPSMSEKLYKSNYVHWMIPIEKYVLPNTQKIVIKKYKLGRNRLQFILKNGGIVEVKVKSELTKDNFPCKFCKIKDYCEEEFGDYLRITPDLKYFFCYYRRDIGGKLTTYDDMKKNITKIRGWNEDETEMFLKNIKWRFLITSRCNYNCKLSKKEYYLCNEKL